MFKSRLKVELSHDHWVSCLGVLGDPGPSPWLLSLAFLSDEGSHWGILSWRGTWSNFNFSAKNKSVSVDRQWARAGEGIGRKARMLWCPYQCCWGSALYLGCHLPLGALSRRFHQPEQRLCFCSSFQRIWNWSDSQKWTLFNAVILYLVFTKCMSSFPKILLLSQTFFRI